MLRNPTHAGLVRVKKTGKMVQGQHWEHRLYQPEVYDQIMEAFGRHKQFPTNTAKSEQCLLAGMVTCARCGKRLYSAQCGRKVPALSCMAGLNRGRRPCSGIRVKVPLLDEILVTAIKNLAQNPKMQQLLQVATAEIVDRQDHDLLIRQRQLQEHLAKSTTDLQKAMDAFFRELISDGQLKEISVTLNEQKAMAQQKLAKV